MAVTLEKRFSVNVGQIVQDAIDSVKAVAKSEQARFETEFQKAVADGLSYEDQVKLREAQLEQARAGGFADETFIADMTQAISTTKRLMRFSKYRTKYADTLGELNSGRINEEEYLNTLKESLKGVEDPDLRTEIMNDIAGAETQVKNYKDTILANRIKKVQYDGTSKELNRVIKEVRSARASAKLRDNQDEVTAYDETLAALESQLSTTQIEDSMTDFQATSASRGMNPMEKLNYINSQAEAADSNRRVKIGNKTYDSAQQFWNLERDSYMSGTSQVFGDFFTELKNDVSGKIASSVSKFGYPTVSTLDEAVNTFESLRQRPEVQPFINRLDVARVGALDEPVRGFADYIVRVGSQNLDFNASDALLTSIEQKTGVSTADYKVLLRNQNIASGEEMAERFGEGGAAARTVESDIALPSLTPAPAPIATPTLTTPTPADAGASRLVKQGDTLSKIAMESGISLNRLLELNPTFKSNPNLIMPGQEIKLPTVSTAAPVPAPTVPTPKPKAPPVEPVKPVVTDPKITDTDALKKIRDIAAGILDVQKELNKGIEPSKTP